MFESNRKLLPVVIAVALVVVAAVSSFVTIKVHNYVLASDGDRVMLTGEQYANWQKAKRLNEIAAIIGEEYITKMSNEDLYEGAYQGMIAALDDPYARYYTPEEYKEYQEKSQGVYAGIGVSVTMTTEDNMLTVVQVFTGTPAEGAGIQKGDKFIFVDATDVRGMPIDDVVAMIKGEQGSKVDITVLRQGETLAFRLERDIVTINQVDSMMLDADIGYVQILEFQGNAVSGFKKALADFQEDDAKGIILDLRDNPGGMMDVAVDIADLLTPEGWIVYTETRSGTREVYASDPESLGLPIVVLVNENSASASEVLAGCLQDHGVGTLVGVNTYGKGVVQTIHFFKEDAAGMKLTTARYYTPKGRSIDGTGLMPDVEVALPEGITEYGGEDDTQLNRAIEVLRDRINNP